MDILEEAKKLGLNSYEANVYLALLERDALTVSEVSRISRVPRGRVYDILDSLVVGGLASLRPGKFKKYSAANPEILEEKLINQAQEEYAEKKRTVEKAVLTLKRKFDSTNHHRANSANPLDYIEIIKDPYQIHKKFIQLIGEAKNEILVLSKPPYTGPKEILDEQTQKQSEPLRRGIAIKCIYEIPLDGDDLEWWQEDIVSSMRQGEKARVIKKLPMKMAIFDERTVLLPLEDPISSEILFTAQVVIHPALAKSLKITFETLWQQAEDYHALKK